MVPHRGPPVGGPDHENGEARNHGDGRERSKRPKPHRSALGQLTFVRPLKQGAERASSELQCRGGHQPGKGPRAQGDDAVAAGGSGRQRPERAEMSDGGEVFHRQAM